MKSAAYSHGVVIEAHLIALAPPCSASQLYWILLARQPLKPTQRHGAGDPFCVAEERKAGRIRAGVV